MNNLNYSINGNNNTQNTQITVINIYNKAKKIDCSIIAKLKKCATTGCNYTPERCEELFEFIVKNIVDSI